MPIELYTCMLEVTNLVNQHPAGSVPNDPEGRAYLCPNDMLLGRVSPQVQQGPLHQTKNSRKRVEFVHRIVDCFWEMLDQRHISFTSSMQEVDTIRGNIQVDDFVTVVELNKMRSISRVVELYPRQDMSEKRED